MGVSAYLRRHPVLCLLLLSPGIPEYLTSSSPLNAIVLNPPQFFFQLALNLGLYGPGVLLVREAHIRWKKGVASVLLMGAAYGILEEGVALSTLFNPSAGPVGELGSYGHWMGVNWIWAAGIVPVHMIFSISLPILLLGLAIPQTRGQRFLGGRKLWVGWAVIGLDVAFLFALILMGVGFWMGWPVFLGSWGAIILLVVAARRVPNSRLAPRAGPPAARPRRVGLIGAVFYPAVLLSEFIPLGLHVPAAIDFVVLILVQGAFLLYFMKTIGTLGNERVLLALCLGLIIPVAAIGLIASFRFPLNIVADGVMILFFRTLWREYPGAGQTTATQGGSEKEMSNLPDGTPDLQDATSRPKVRKVNTI